MGWNAGGLNNEGTFTPDELLVAVEMAGVRTIASGAGVLARGAVLGKITATGKLTLSVVAANDGSQTPYAILAESIDASAADVNAVVYLAATVNSNSLSYGAGHSAATVFDPLRAVDIHVVTAQQ